MNPLVATLNRVQLAAVQARTLLLVVQMLSLFDMLNVMLHRLALLLLRWLASCLRTLSLSRALSVLLWTDPRLVSTLLCVLR